MPRSDTHYCSGDEIQVGDRVTCAAWTGVFVFVLGTESFADGYTSEGWSYLGRGIMIQYDQAGMVFSEEAVEDLVVVARSQALTSTRLP